MAQSEICASICQSNLKRRVNLTLLSVIELSSFSTVLTSATTPTTLTQCPTVPLISPPLYPTLSPLSHPSTVFVSFFFISFASSPPGTYMSLVTGWWRRSLASTRPWWSWSISPVTPGCGTQTTLPCCWPRWVPRIRRYKGHCFKHGSVLCFSYTLSLCCPCRHTADKSTTRCVNVW